MLKLYIPSVIQVVGDACRCADGGGAFDTSAQRVVSIAGIVSGTLGDGEAVVDVPSVGGTCAIVREVSIEVIAGLMTANDCVFVDAIGGVAKRA